MFTSEVGGQEYTNSGKLLYLGYYCYCIPQFWPGQIGTVRGYSTLYETDYEIHVQAWLSYTEDQWLKVPSKGRNSFIVHSRTLNGPWGTPAVVWIMTYKCCQSISDIFIPNYPKEKSLHDFPNWDLNTGPHGHAPEVRILNHWPMPPYESVTTFAPLFVVVGVDRGHPFENSLIFWVTYLVLIIKKKIFKNSGGKITLDFTRIKCAHENKCAPALRHSFFVFSLLTVAPRKG